MADTIDTLITGIQTSKGNIATAIENKGVTVPSGTKLAGMATLINQISVMHGPNVSVDGNIAAFDGTGGDTLKDSGIASTSIVTTGDDQTINSDKTIAYGKKIIFADNTMGSDPELKSGTIGAGGPAVELTGTGLILNNLKMSGGIYTTSNTNYKLVFPDTTS